MRVEIWSDVACPWCYIGKARFEQGLAGFEHKDEVEVVFRSYELDPNRAEGDTTQVIPMLARKYGMSEAQARQAEQRVADNARSEGLGYIAEGRDHGSTFAIHRLLHFAKTKGVQNELIDLTFKANFAEERSVFDRARVLELAVEAGLDKDDAAAVYDDPEAYATEVRQDEREAQELGANGVPFFVLDRRYGVSGGQPADVFKQALEEAWATRPQPLKLPSVPGLGPDDIGVSGDVCGPDGCAVPQR
ncbi:DsbA family oxidoreductase [Actinospica sp. MGRD01-02]|uniref:DsbA family oxidoreductase n=1 Tax=Actinospica acidithermotolerans TaxID=2828514 RepID=A0A941EGY1_9ACTN|nr:DsbA family oxidoreductase [Actinospica acidithermotolerans]MBR7831096.1 DsbA family oxidoreductase [Actinospica acidithermotolerans]